MPSALTAVNTSSADKVAIFAHIQTYILCADASRHQYRILTAGAVCLKGLPCLPYRREKFALRNSAPSLLTP